MYLVYCVVFKIHLFIFLLKVANFAQRDKHHLFREIYIFCSYFIVMGTSETLAPAGELKQIHLFDFLNNQDPDQLLETARCAKSPDFEQTHSS